MEIPSEEIDELAERIISKYSTQYPIDPYEIAEKLGIEVIEGKFGKYFRGLIKYLNCRFYILLNFDLLKKAHYALARYTCSHELGHFFLKKHRNRLKLGQSIAFSGSSLKSFEKKILESEAQQFAASLLMPKNHFKTSYIEFGKQGFEAIFALKSYYNVSVTTALIRFVRLDLEPTVSITWTEQGILNKGVSNSFASIIGNNGLSIKLNLQRPLLEEKIKVDKLTKIEYHQSITPLSSWSYNLPKEFANEFFVIEETMYTKYYNITLLRIIT
ncbi:ImmA/IrrE family metallo-endopeptidase [uncultured Croceitalea sp.]|uniref:ImmA/IrrE family metallo-endopeptidase n=1 Tax=uncultured Croceitalea sp. TaxID=1798908 RepID=UPI0033061B73